jgi:hypothetical protein
MGTRISHQQSLRKSLDGDEFVQCRHYTTTIYDVPFNPEINYDVVKVKMMADIYKTIDKNRLIYFTLVLYIDRGGEGGHANRWAGFDQDTCEKSVTVDMLKHDMMNADYETFCENIIKRKRDIFTKKFLQDKDLIGNVYFNFRKIKERYL